MNKEDRRIISDYIKQRISNHTSEERIGFIQFGYEAYQGGLFCVYLDSSSDAGPTGTWTIRLEGNSIEMNHWPELVATEGDASVEKMGDAIKEIVFELKNEGIFDDLSKTADCDFGIEEMQGGYGWPVYEQRKKVNLVYRDRTPHH